MTVEAVDHMVRSIVANPETVGVDRVSSRHVEVIVDPRDLGRVIGRGGRTASAIRTLASIIGDDRLRVDINAFGVSRGKKKKTARRLPDSAAAGRTSEAPHPAVADPNEDGISAQKTAVVAQTPTGALAHMASAVRTSRRASTASPAAGSSADNPADAD